MGSSSASGSEYIKHHLHHLSVGDGFWAVHIDTFIVSWIIGIFFLFIFRSVAKNASSGVPNKLQNFVEFLYDFADSSKRYISWEKQTNRSISFNCIRMGISNEFYG